MNRQQLFAFLELATGLAALVGFMIVLVLPALSRLIVDLAWTLRAPPYLPRFGINPHWAAEAQYAPSIVALLACAGLAVCYRWLSSRRRE